MKFLTVLALAAIVYTANGAALQKRDLKSDLLTRADTLDTQTKDEIKKLTDGGKAGEATHLEREEKALVKLAADLKAATADQAIHRLEVELRGIEMRIAEELRRLEHGGHRTTGTPATTTTASLVKRDLKSDLLTRAATLETQATDEIKKLTADGKERETALLKREERRLHELATELKAATTESPAVHRIEIELRAIESRIAEELRRIEHRGTGTATTGTPAATTEAPATTKASIVKRDEKDTVVAQAKEVLKKATAEVKKLEAADRKADAATLKREETALQKLVTELEAATDADKIKRLDTEVKASDKRINEELHRLEGKTKPPKSTTTAAPTTTKASIVKRDLKSDLLARAESLQTRATADSKKLTDAGKTTEAGHLDKQVDELKKLATDLKAATAEPEIRRLETQLRAIETRIAEELRRIERGGARTTAAPTTAGSF